MPDHASGKSKTSEEIEEEISPIVKDLRQKKIEDQGQIRYIEEAQARKEMKIIDNRYRLAMVLVLGYLILLGLPLYRNDDVLLKTIASTLSGPVGAVLGYYFGYKQAEDG
jgi:hypothetical protein